MVSSEVQRTLVKSPPELWAELGDPVSLARHLSALGEIRITHVQLEERVEWEAEKTTGAVSIKPSGWGTKVTLSVTRETEMLSVPQTAAEETDTASSAAAETTPAPETATAEQEAAAPAPEADVEPQPRADLTLTAKSEPDAPAAAV